VYSDGHVNANGTWEITVTGTNTFTLDGSVGNGTSSSTSRRLVRINRRVVRLPSAFTQNIACTGWETTAAWTASANVTSTLNTTSVKEHRASTNINITATFTTGKAAYYTLPSTLDLSSYQQLSLWVRQETGTLASTISIALCSDTIGDTIVNSFAIPVHHVLTGWRPVTINYGSALGSNIQSIAVYVVTDIGACIFQFDNIIACQAPSSNTSIALDSLISPTIQGVQDDEVYFAIQSINGTRICLSQNYNTQANAANQKTFLTYPHPSAGFPTSRKRETIKISVGQVINEGGSASGNIVFSGGWDRTNMSTQTLETWLDGERTAVTGLLSSGKSYVEINKFAFFNFNIGLQISGTCDYVSIGTITANNCVTQGILYNAVGIQHSIFYIKSITNLAGNDRALVLSTNGLHIGTIGTLLWNGTGGTSSNSLLITNNNITIDSIRCILAATYIGIYIGTTGRNIRIGSIDYIDYATFYGIHITGNCSVLIKSVNISNLQTSASVSRGIGLLDSARLVLLGGSTSSSVNGAFQLQNVELTLKNFTINDTIEFAYDATLTNQCGFYQYSENHDGVSNNHKIFNDVGLISADSVVRHTNSGISWKFQPTAIGANGCNENYPLKLSIAKIAVAADNEVTITAWGYKTNSDLTLQLVFDNIQEYGMMNISNNFMGINFNNIPVNTWTQGSYSFTPYASGVVELFAVAYGGTTYTGYIDDLTITQV
jgi:hypothetical protein